MFRITGTCGITRDGDLVRAWSSPELNLKAARQYARDMAAMHTQGKLHHFVPPFILPAVRGAGDDPRPPVVARGFKSPYGASNDGSRVAGSWPR